MIIQRGITEGGVETLTRTPRFCSLAWQKPALSVPSVSDEAGLHQAAQACETQGEQSVYAHRDSTGVASVPLVVGMMAGCLWMVNPQGPQVHLRPSGGIGDVEMYKCRSCASRA